MYLLYKCPSLAFLDSNDCKGLQLMWDLKGYVALYNKVIKLGKTAKQLPGGLLQYH